MNKLIVYSYNGILHSKRKEQMTTPLMGFPRGSADKESTRSAGDLGSIPGLGRSLGEGNGYLLQYSGLKNPMDRGAWWALLLGVAKSQTRLSDFHITKGAY